MLLCETCIFYGEDAYEQPCCSCCGGECYEKDEDLVKEMEEELARESEQG